MLKYLLPLAIIIPVVLVSGCTSLSLTDETVSINNNPYDTFTSTITTGSCVDVYMDQYPNSAEADCVITRVDLQVKTFDCRCVVDTGIV